MRSSSCTNNSDRSDYVSKMIYVGTINLLNLVFSTIIQRVRCELIGRFSETEGISYDVHQ